MKEKNSYSKQNGNNMDDAGDPYSLNEWENAANEENLEDDMEWDGSEAELIVEDQAEEYEENPTGIKIKYSLSEEMITGIFAQTDGYTKNRKWQRIHTVIQSAMLLILIALWNYSGNMYYMLLMLIPIICIGALWVIPFFSFKKLVSEFYTGKEISLEIFPDKISVNIEGNINEIELDQKTQYEELIDRIMVYPETGNVLMIPKQDIEPDFLPDVQAMIFAGAQPKDDK